MAGSRRDVQAVKVSQRKSVTADRSVEGPFSPPLRYATDKDVEDNMPRSRSKMSVAVANSGRQNPQSSLQSTPRLSGARSFRVLREAAPNPRETLRLSEIELKAIAEVSSETCVVTPKHQRTH